MFRIFYSRPLKFRYVFNNFKNSRNKRINLLVHNSFKCSVSINVYYIVKYVIRFHIFSSFFLSNFFYEMYLATAHTLKISRSVNDQRLNLPCHQRAQGPPLRLPPKAPYKLNPPLVYGGKGQLSKIVNIGNWFRHKLI